MQASLRRRPVMGNVFAALNKILNPDAPDEPPPPRGELDDPIPVDPKQGVFVRCTITDPPSSAGRNLNVYFDPEEVDWLLLHLRANAIARRRQ